MFKKISLEIYQKFSIFNNSNLDLTSCSKEVTIHNIITSIFIK